MPTPQPKVEEDPDVRSYVPVLCQAGSPERVERLPPLTNPLSTDSDSEWRHRLFSELGQLKRQLDDLSTGQAAVWADVVGTRESLASLLNGQTSATIPQVCFGEQPAATVEEPTSPSEYHDSMNCTPVSTVEDQGHLEEKKIQDGVVLPRGHSSCSSELTRVSNTSSPSSPKMRKSLSFTQSSRLLKSQQNANRGLLDVIVRSNRFEMVFGGMIFANTVVMALEAQFSGTKVGSRLQYPSYSADPNSIWPGATTTFYVLDMLFGLTFCIELILKAMCFRLDFPKDIWNWIDSAIVGSWFIFTIAGFELAIDPILLRLTRLVRLLRLARLAKTITAFDSLFLMTTSMRGSLSVLMWSSVLLVLVLMMCGLFVQVMVEPYISEETNPIDKRKDIFRFYGTFARTMLTMFEITVGNWMPPCRALVDNITEVWMVFFISHKMVMGFSVVAVINAVFIQETFKVATHDDRILLMQKTRAIKVHKEKMTSLFEHADTDNDGTLSLNEFRAVLEERDVKNWMAAMELDVVDVESAFGLIDDGDHQLTVEEFCEGVARLRGMAKAIDVLLLKQQVGHLQKSLQEHRELVERILSRRVL